MLQCLEGNSYVPKTSHSGWQDVVGQIPNVLEQTVCDRNVEGLYQETANQMETNTHMLHVWSSSFAPWLGQCYWIVQTCAWNIWDTLWTFTLCSWVYHTHEISTAAAHFSRRRDFGVTKPGITTPSWSFRAIHLEDLGCCPNAVRCCPSRRVWLKFKADKAEKWHWGKGSTKKKMPNSHHLFGWASTFSESCKVSSPSHAKYLVTGQICSFRWNQRVHRSHWFPNFCEINHGFVEHWWTLHILIDFITML